MTGLIDVHAHFTTPEYVAAASSGGNAHPDGMPAWPDWSVEEHVRLMDESGIDRSVLSVSSPGVHFGDDEAATELARMMNRHAAGVRAQFPSRFDFFGALPLPDVGSARREAAFALDELGARGVAVLSNSQGMYLGDELLDPLWGDLDSRAALVFVHPTSPVCHEQTALGRPRPMLEFLVDSARSVTDLVWSGVPERFPSIQFVLTHGGGILPLIADRLELFRTAFFGGDPEARSFHQVIAGFWFDMAGTPFPRQVPAIADLVGSDRLVYGSDYCFTPPPAVAAQIQTIESEETDWRRVTTENAERLGLTVR